MPERSEKTAAKKSPGKKSGKGPDRRGAKVTETVEQAKAKQEEFATRAQEATPEAANQAAQKTAETIQENPIPTAVAGGFAAGFLLGWLLGRR
jgi:ElaB/YqjD/DUF883 family membrane-anchored ribosome-binding protein